jgi:hypothetical protein
MPRDKDDDDGDLPFDMGIVKVLRVTDKALLAVSEAMGEQWIPKSVVHDDSEVWKKDDNGMLVVLTWWAKKNVSDA